jgi:hypothetical protein
MNRSHKDKMKELIRNLMPVMVKTCEQFYNSGAINISAFNPDEYILAKILVTAAMEKHTEDYQPFHDEYKKEIQNLKYF